MSLAGNSADCQTVVSQVCRRQSVQALTNCHSWLVLDSLADWKPVKVTKHRRNVVELFLLLSRPEQLHSERLVVSSANRQQHSTASCYSSQDGC